MDQLAPLLRQITLSAQSFFSGDLCQLVDFDEPDRPGHIHILKSGQVTMTIRRDPPQVINRPSVLFFPRPCPHTLVPVDASCELLCAYIDLGIKVRSPLAMALPEVLVLPFDDMNPVKPTLELLFREAFDEVNARFKKMFPRMFGGGRAELRLTEAEDLLEAGIDIVAQPPGKKLTSIELMSGGEKALTAVSLIFSLFQFKPSPFCLLDEVDAPLDDANIGRFVRMLNEFKQKTQFIVITHNPRTTTEAADAVYGITMQEPGVSSVVSVRMRGPNLDDTSREDDEPADSAIVADAAPPEAMATSL